jgi:hypothetical protein
MAPVKKKPAVLTDDEMDALVIADAHDPAAWGDPIVVPASKSKRPAWIARAKHFEAAAKFYVVSMLHQLGVDATVTISQQDNVDITVVQESGRALTVDVKTLTGSREWPVGDFKAREGHYLAFVWYPAGKGPNQPTVYIVASQRLKTFLNRKHIDILTLDLLAEKMAAREAWQELAPAA